MTKTAWKQIGLIAITLILFSLSIYIAFLQGGVSGNVLQHYPQSILTGIYSNPIVYTGFRAEVASVFAVIFNIFMKITGGSVILSIIILALSVELLLLYPSILIQFKQKKIHLFHQKLVDKFNNGKLSVSKTKQELHKVYDVNQKIHQRGAILVAIQIAIFFVTFWGLNLIIKAPEMLYGSWNLLNFSLLSKNTGFTIPVLAGALYFLHSMVKIYFKKEEDYVSPSQILAAMFFTIIGSSIVYIFSGIFAVVLSVYFITLITFSTVRYILIEKYTENWRSSFIKKELIKMLREAKPHKNRFQYFSRIWSHLPIVRHINFNLLEEALSMSLGLLVAVSLF